MGIGDKIGKAMLQAGERQREGAQRLLEPGEPIQAMFLAQTGPSPRIPWEWIFVFGNLVKLVFGRYHVVVVTDRNIVLFKANVAASQPPTAVAARLPREPFGTPEGRNWGKVMISGKRYWVHRNFFNNVAAANRALAAA